MTFQELGATLKAEREKRHLSIADVASQLKINPRLLMALESGDGQALPHPAYARGFIRSYAGFLGIPPEEVQTWLAGLEPEDLKKPKPVPVQDDYLPPPEPKPARRSGSGIWVLLVLCCLAGAGWWAWDSGLFSFLLDVKKERPADLVKNLPGADTYVAKKEPPRQEYRPEPPKPVVAPVEIPQPAPAPEPQPVAQPEPQQETVVVAEEPESRDSGPEQHKLVIIATEECWVHSSADKTDTRQFSLRKGDTFALTFAKNLELKLGNAGGVRLRYDGTEMPPAGTSGQVRTLTFPPKDS